MNYLFRNVAIIHAHVKRTACWIMLLPYRFIINIYVHVISVFQILAIQQMTIKASVFKKCLHHSVNYS